MKVSRIILGFMSYGHKGWAEWVIDDEEEVIKHVKYAFVYVLSLLRLLFLPSDSSVTMREFNRSIPLT